MLILFFPETVKEDGVTGGCDAVFLKLGGSKVAGFLMFLVLLRVLLPLLGGHLKIASHFEMNSGGGTVFGDDTVDHFAEFVQRPEDEGVVDVGKVGVVMV